MTKKETLGTLALLFKKVDTSLYPLKRVMGQFIINFFHHKPGTNCSLKLRNDELEFLRKDESRYFNFMSEKFIELGIKHGKMSLGMNGDPDTLNIEGLEFP